MQGLMVVFTFFVLDRKYLFWTKLVPKIKIVSLSLNLVPKLIRICRIQWLYSLFHVRLEIPFLGKLFPKFKIVWLNSKFGTWTNSNIENSMLMFSNSCILFLESFSKNSKLFVEAET